MKAVALVLIFGLAASAVSAGGLGHALYDRAGYDCEGYDPEGYDREGFNRNGVDRQGFDRRGFDAEGRDRLGRLQNGFQDTTVLVGGASLVEGLRRWGLVVVAVEVRVVAPYNGGLSQATRVKVLLVLAGHLLPHEVWIYFPIRKGRPWEVPNGGLNPAMLAPESKLLLVLEGVRHSYVDTELRHQARLWFPIPYRDTLVDGLELRVTDKIPSKEIWSLRRQEQLLNELRSER